MLFKDSIERGVSGLGDSIILTLSVTRQTFEDVRDVRFVPEADIPRTNRELYFRSTVTFPMVPVNENGGV